MQIIINVEDPFLRNDEVLKNRAMEIFNRLISDVGIMQCLGAGEIILRDNDNKIIADSDDVSIDTALEKYRRQLEG